MFKKKNTHSTTNKNKSKKKINSKRQKDSKIEQDKSELAKNLNIRISHPYGYYPEDVDPIISKLQSENALLSKDNKILNDKLKELQKSYDAMQKEFAAFKLHSSIFEAPELNMEEALEGISKLETINGKPNTISPINNLVSMLDDTEEELPMEIKQNPAQKLKIKNKPGGN